VELAEEYGTPLFVFDEDRIRQNYLRFRRAFETHYPNSIVSYSIKTNSNLAICKVLQQFGAYAEVCSELDLYTAIKAGFDPKHIVLDGPYKPESLLRAAVDEGISMINVEYLSELEQLNKIAGKLEQNQAIGLRVNLIKRRLFKSDPSSRFGFSVEEAFRVLKQMTKFENLQVKGIMAHPYLGAAELLIPFVKRIYDELGIRIEFVNLGGGFDPDTDIEQVGRSITELVKKLSNQMEPTIVLEPGRFIISDAGFLLFRVAHVKEVSGRKWVTVDGGFNVLPSYNGRRKVRILNRINSQPKDFADIVGPIPYSHDFVSIKTYLPEVHEGDVLVVFDSGAYTLGNLRQFLYPRPYVLMLSRQKGIVKIREKETFEDVLRMDRVNL
jgi:diaminopimelate decarboxylase